MTFYFCKSGNPESFVVQCATDFQGITFNAFNKSEDHSVEVTLSDEEAIKLTNHLRELVNMNAHARRRKMERL